MAAEPLSKHARDLARSLVEARILSDEQAKKIERLLAEGNQEKAGKLLGRYLDRKDRGR